MNPHATEGKDIRFAVREQVPHKDRMLLIDGTAYKDGDTVKLSFVVPGGSVFVAPDGVLAPVAMVEMLAQLFPGLVARLVVDFEEVVHFTHEGALEVAQPGVHVLE